MMSWDPKYESPSWQSNRFDSPEEDWRNIPEQSEPKEFEWEDEKWIKENMRKKMESWEKEKSTFSIEHFREWEKNFNRINKLEEMKYNETTK